MVKEPAIGRVKTRLAHEVGGVRATSAYRALSAATLQRLVGTRPTNVALVLAVAPHAAVGSRTVGWPMGFDRMAQAHGDLGRRMARGLSAAILGVPQATPVLLLGSDIVGVTWRVLRRAKSVLRRGDATLGGTTDGGFWLIGVRGSRRLHQPFVDVTWSTPDTAAQTRRDLTGRLRRKLSDAPRLDDLDTRQDLMASRGRIGRVVLPTNRSGENNRR